MNNNRLKKVLEYIEPNAMLADVGCDHGYLAIEAIKKGVSIFTGKDNNVKVKLENVKWVKNIKKKIKSLQ